VAKAIGDTHDPLDHTSIERRPMNVATVAYANKLARIAWAIMIREDRYNPVRAFAAVA
jgi:transposase